MIVKVSSKPQMLQLCKLKETKKALWVVSTDPTQWMTQRLPAVAL